MLSKNKADVKLELSKGAKKLDLREVVRSSNKAFLKIFVRYFIISSIVLILLLFDVFNIINNFFEATARSFIGLDPLVLSIALLYGVSPPSAIMTAGNLLLSGVLDAKKALLGLIIGRLFFLLISEYPRHSFPFYLTFYPTKTAVKMTFILIINLITLSLQIFLVNII